MEPSQPTFDEWWDEFVSSDRHEDPYHSIKELRHFAAALPPTKRDAFVSGLVDVACQRRRAWHLALGALETLATRSARQRLMEVVTKLPPVRPPHELGDYRHGLLRVLASAPDSEFIGPVETYCNQEIGPGYTSVVWRLWPYRRDLFAKYHARYFAEVPRDRWTATFVIGAFTSEPEALAAVRDVLLRDNPDTWKVVRDAVPGASASSWVKPDQRELIARVCDESYGSK